MPDGMLEDWNNGMMEQWNDGMLEYWNDGIMECWNIGIMVAPVKQQLRYSCYAEFHRVSS